MKDLIRAAGLLLMDLASTLVFLAALMIGHNVSIAIGAGMAFGVAQMAFELIRKQPIGVMQWLSFAMVIGFGVVSLVTNDPRFVMAKPSLIYLIVGVVMLKPGWMIRYVPDDAKDLVGDLAFLFGYIWAGLMFVSAGVVFYAAMTMKPVPWATFVSVWGIVSKLGLFLLQFVIMRTIGRQRFAARATPVSA